ELVHQYIEQSRGRIAPVRRIRYQGTIKQISMDSTAYPFFPGLGEAYGIDVGLQDGSVETLTARDLSGITGIDCYEPRVSCLVGKVIQKMRVLEERRGPHDVVSVALSSDLRDLCTRPTRHKRQPARKDSLVTAARKALEKQEQSGQSSLFGI